MRLSTLHSVVTLLAALASLPAASHATEPTPKQVPVRMSVLMGLTQGWQEGHSRACGETLLGFDLARDLELADPATALDRWFSAAQAAEPGAGRSGETWAAPALTSTAPAQADAPATALPEHALSADYAASGFRPAVAVETNHRAFADDMLAAPARTRLASEATTAWLGDTPAVPAWHEEAPSAVGRGGYQAGASWNDVARTVTALPGAPTAANVSYTDSSRNPIPAAASTFSGGSSQFARGETLEAISAVGIPAAVVSPAGASGTAGAARSWGKDDFGQLGNGTSGTANNSSSPVQVSGLTTGVTAIAGGATHGLALQNGVVYAWGDNTYGEIGDNTTTQRNAPVAVSGLGSGVTYIAAGDSYSLAIQNGAVKAWGVNLEGELGDGTTTQRNTPVLVTGLGSGVTALAGSYYNSMAIQNGAVKAWGYNNFGMIGDGTTTQRNVPTQVTGLTSGATAIAAGTEFSLAVVNGAAKSWGLNSSGELGDGTTTQRLTPVSVLNLSTGVTSVAAGQEHGLAVKNGNVYSWGLNNQGELGNGTHDSGAGANPHPTPAIVSVGGTPLSNIVAVYASVFSSYALVGDGSLWVWGNNGNGELGLGNTTEQDTPQHLFAPTGFYYSGFSVGSNSSSTYAILTSSVPEPSTWLGGLGLLGTAGLLLRRRRLRGVAV